MGIGLLAVIALLGIGLAASGAKAKAPPSPPKSKVKIVKPKKKKKKKAKRPPKKKEVKAAKKIKKAKIPKNKKGDEILKKLTEIVVKDDPNTHPIVKEAAKEKIKKSGKPKPSKKAVSKLFRSKATKGFPYVWKNKKNKKRIWANKKGSDSLAAGKKHKFIKFNPKLATGAQKRFFDKAMKALAPKPPKIVPVAPGPNLAELAKIMRTKATPGFPYVFLNTANNARIWANKPGELALRSNKNVKFIQFDRALATAKQRQEFDAALRALAPDGPAPLPPATKREIVKEVVKNDESPVTPQQAAKALQIYTKEGGWQGDKSKPSQVVYDCQRRMGQSRTAADGIIGQGTRTLARNLGSPLYARSYTASGAYNKAKPLTNRW